jgi:EAL and modified HD-GYP domain-containing signal transduction protein
MRELDMATTGPVSTGDAATVYLGRQPIMDRDGALVGYELLYRGSAVNSAIVADDTQATSQVIATMLGEFGMRSVLGSDVGYINVNREILFSDVLAVLPSHLFVLEILESVALDESLLTRCGELRAQGFRLAFDDLSLASPEALDNLHAVDIAKVDFGKCALEDLPGIVARIKKAGCTALAEKVETVEAYDYARKLGFDLFQGYFFARPEVLSSRRLISDRAPLLSLLGLLSRDPGLRQVEMALKRIPKLIVQLLRFANSGAHSLARPVTSLREATIAVGTRQISRWTQLLLYANSDDKPLRRDPLIQMIGTRARFMELTAESLFPNDDDLADQAFMTGVFSMAEAMFGSTGENVLVELQIPGVIARAIQNREGRLGAFLACAEAAESGDLEKIAQACSRLPGFSSQNAAHISLEALKWISQHSASV